MPHAIGYLHEWLDSSRRLQGTLLDMLGLGPVETPFREVVTGPTATLRAYGGGGNAQPTVLIVPAPIKQAYIWDLFPAVSVVRQCIENGIQTYLIHWENPGAGGQESGLADYAERTILDCLKAVERDNGTQRVFLAGHSLGGTLGAIFSSLHPDLVQGLILAGAPLHFGEETDAFAPLIAAAPPIRYLTEFLGNVPGSFLDAISMMAAPETFGWSRWDDLLASLADPAALRTHICVERWSLDEIAMPRRLFEDIVELLYREDRFMKGTLLVRGRPAVPARVKAPLLTIIESQSRIAPPQAVLPFHYAARSAAKRLLWYAGDTGVALQHAGMLAGRTAHQYIWPEAVRWIHAHGSKLGT